jgi:hypothetical protein
MIVHILGTYIRIHNLLLWDSKADEFDPIGGKWRGNRENIFTKKKKKPQKKKDYNFRKTVLEFNVPLA